GQTLRLSSRSFFQIIWRQPSHFTHSPSVRTLFSPEVSNSPDCRLNQAIREVVSGQWSVVSGGLYWPLITDHRPLVFDSSLRHHAFLVGVLYLPHFRHRIGQFDNCRMRVPSGQDHVHHLRLLFQRLHHFRRVQHAVADG